MKKIALLIFLISLLPTNCFGQNALQPLLDSLTLLLEKKHIPGAMISIVKRDSVIFTGGVGLANIDHQEKVTADHLFRLGSVSKSFTALALVQLAEKETFSLSTPILEIDKDIPIQNDWATTAPITTAHLLEHTAGFDDMHLNALYNRTDSIAPSCKALMQAHQNALYTRWTPGTRMAYSNPGYVVAGHLIEMVSQQSYHQYIKTALLEPLGMLDAGFYFTEPTNLPMAKGYSYEGKQYQPVKFARIQGGPAGELCANAKEMAMYLQFMLNRSLADSNHQIVSPTSFNRIENAQTTIAAKNGLKGDYGLGNYNSWKYGIPFQGHSGAIDGFSANYIYSRKADIGIAVAINKQGNIRPIINKILDHFFDKPQSAPIDRPTAPISTITKDTYAGFYTFNYPRNQLFGSLKSMFTGVELEFNEDSVFVKDILGNLKDTLYHAGDNQFYSRNEGIPFAMLLKDKAENNQSVFWLAGEYGERSTKNFQLLKMGLFLAAILLILLFGIYGFFWWISQFFTKKKKSKTSRLHLWLAALSFVLLLVFLLYSLENIKTAGTLHVGTFLLFVSSLCFFIFALIAFFLSFKLKGEGLFFKFYYRITALATIGLAIFLLWNDLIGLQLWNY